jgi:hypothetical protein
MLKAASQAMARRVEEAVAHELGQRGGSSRQEPQAGGVITVTRALGRQREHLVCGGKSKREAAKGEHRDKGGDPTLGSRNRAMCNTTAVNNLGSSLRKKSG